MKKVLLLSSIFALIFLIGFQKYSVQNQPPVAIDKQSLQRQVFEKGRMAYVYPDQSPLAADYLSVINNLSERSRRIKIFPVPASKFDTLAADVPAVLLGTPGNNPALPALLSKLPFQFEKDSFTVNGYTFDQREDRVSFSIPSPEPPHRYLSVVTGNDEESILKNMRMRRRGGAGDYSVYRGENLAAYGFFSWPSPGEPFYGSVESIYKIKSEAEVNFLREERRVLENKYFTIDYTGRKPSLEKIRQFADEQGRYVQRQLKQLDAKDKTIQKILPIPLLSVSYTHLTLPTSFLV